MNCGRRVIPAGETTRIAFLGGRLRLRQPNQGTVRHDAILLAAATRRVPGDRVVEFAPARRGGVTLARRVGAIDLMLVEIDAQLTALARDNAVANAIPARMSRSIDLAAELCRFRPVADSVDVV